MSFTVNNSFSPMDVSSSYGIAKSGIPAKTITIVEDQKDPEAQVISESERSLMLSEGARGNGHSEVKPTQPKTDSSDCFGISSARFSKRLTGGIMIPPPQFASVEMHKNYELAKSLIEYVGKTVLFSYNYPNRSSSIISKYTNPDILNYYIEAIEEVFSTIRHLESHLPKGGSALEIIRRRAKLVEKYNVGNCSEMAYVALSHAMDIKATQRVEFCLIQNGDHAFLVIGRKGGNYPSQNYKNWGPDAYICGPWEESCYPASMLESHLYDFDDTFWDPGDSEYCTVVKLFDPFKQSLKPLVAYPGSKSHSP